MAGTTTDPLTRAATPAEAKQRLREVAADIGVRAWVRRHPYRALAAAAAGGLLLGRIRGTGGVTGERILSLLLLLLR